MIDYHRFTRMSHNTQRVTMKCHYATLLHWLTKLNINPWYLATPRIQRTSRTLAWVFSFYPWYNTADCYTVVVSKSALCSGWWWEFRYANAEWCAKDCL